jgi:DNA-binding response OmpR family regulator
MCRILLIDDDNNFRAMLGLTLTHFGHTVIEARNGREGLELFPQANVDIVITDIIMPDKEGIEVVMELKKEHSSVKIIAISGGARNRVDGYLHTAKLLGASKVFTKPFFISELMAAINELLAADNLKPTGA